MPKGTRAAQVSHWSGNIGFLCGAAALLIAVLLACLVPNPSHFQAGVFSAFTALGGAGFCTGLTGLLEIKLTGVKAAGPLAIFIILFWLITHMAAPELVGGLDFLWHTK